MAWLLPSRQRIANVKRAIEHFPDKEIVLWRTQDDPDGALYDELEIPPFWEVVLGPAGLRTAEIFNAFFRAFPREKYYGFIGDDVVPAPEDWAEHLQSAAGDMYIAYPTDSYHGDKLCPHFCIGGDLVRKVGAFALPGLYHSFIDTIWFTIGHNVGLLRHVPEVSFDHLHPLGKKVEMDAVYRRGQETYALDKNVFNQWLRFQGKPMIRMLQAWKEERDNASFCRSKEAEQMAHVADV